MELQMNAHILIVEDEEPLTMLLRYNLEAEGYEVETSARGDEADMRLKEKALLRTAPLGVKPARYHPDDELLAFLEGL